MAIFLAIMFSGGAALGRLMIGAAQYIMSSGDPKSLEQAYNTITSAVMGLVLILSAFLVARFLTDMFSSEGVPIDLLKLVF